MVDEKECDDIRETRGAVMCLAYAISVNDTVTSVKPIDLH